MATAAGAAEISGIAVGSTETPGIVKITYNLSEPAIVMMSVKTGGVEVAESALMHLSGDVRRKVSTATGTIYWAADRDLGMALPVGSTIELTPWALDKPPEVMVVDVRMPGNFTFYRSLDGLPDGGLKNDKYRTACMVMKKIPAKGVTFLCGKTGTGVADKYKPYLCTFTNDFYFGIYPSAGHCGNVFFQLIRCVLQRFVSLYNGNFHYESPCKYFDALIIH